VFGGGRGEWGKKGNQNTKSCSINRGLIKKASGDVVQKIYKKNGGGKANEGDGRVVVKRRFYQDFKKA